MRVALVLHGWPPERMGGTGLYVAALARALAAAGHAVALLAPGPASRPGLRPAPDPPPGCTAALLAAPAPRRWSETWRRPDREACFADFCAQWRPDVVHFHHLDGLGLGLLDRRLRGGARGVLTLHDYAIPCARGQLVDGQGALCPGPAPARCAACVADQLGLSPLTRLVGRALAPLPALHRRARRLSAAPAGARGHGLLARRQQAAAAALQQVEVLLSPSQDLADRFAALGLRRPDRCDLPLLFPVPPAPDPGPGPVRFLFASALHPSKGPDRLLRAFAALSPRESTLSLAGPAVAVDGDPRFAARLAQQARATPGVSWLGEVPPGGMVALLHGHDVLALPSRWPENSPLVLREATAAGLRVIASVQGGARELDPTATLIPPGEEGDQALTRALGVEQQRGRARRPPATWKDPAEHARALTAGVYPR